MKCINCGAENKNTNIRCECCGRELHPVSQDDIFLNKEYPSVTTPAVDLNSKLVKVVSTVILIVFLAPWFLVGMIFIGVSGYGIISNAQKSKDYLETQGRLVDYVNFSNEEDGTVYCEAVYEYTVDGVTYTGSPNKRSDVEGFKDVITVKYNPGNPGEYVMDAGWNSLLITGSIMVLVVVIIFISVKVSIRKAADKIRSR